MSDEKGMPGDKEPGSLEFFQTWMENLQSTMLEIKPDPIPEGSALNEQWKESVSAFKVVQQREPQLTQAINRKEGDVEELQNTLKEVQASMAALLEACEAKAKEILESPEVAAFLEGDDDDEWVTWAALKQAEPEDLAKFCEENPDIIDAMVALFKDTDLLRDILLAGGLIAGGNRSSWGKFLQIHNAIKEGDVYKEKVEEHPVLARLALATALQHASPIEVFDTKDVIDPVERYLHFETAYLEGDLDELFPTLTVTDLRMVVDCTSTHEEMLWVRKCMQQYRPDWMLWDDEEGRYVGIVFSDVGYRNPTWTSTPMTMDQILDGGGKCGPWAWWGRFLCKSFGIPTWGIIYPGHACFMRKTTTKGWRISLGEPNNVAVSQWNIRQARDFLWEMQARAVCETELDYQKKVQRLEWAGHLRDDFVKSAIHWRRLEPHPDCLNFGLAFFQKKIMAASASDDQCVAPRFSPSSIVAKREHLAKNKPTERGTISRDADTGIITIPSDSVANHFRSTGHLSFSASFSGGQQIWLAKETVAEYRIPADCVPSAGSYQVVVQYATAHRLDTGLNLRVEAADKETQNCSIDLSYTKGLWEESEPVTIELSGASTLFITRIYKDFGTSMYKIQLTPS